MKSNRQIPSTTWLTSLLLVRSLCSALMTSATARDGVIYGDYTMRAQSVIINGDADPPGR